MNKEETFRKLTPETIITIKEKRKFISMSQLAEIYNIPLKRLRELLN